MFILHNIYPDGVVLNEDSSCSRGAGSSSYRLSSPLFAYFASPVDQSPALPSTLRASLLFVSALENDASVLASVLTSLFFLDVLQKLFLQPLRKKKIDKYSFIFYSEQDSNKKTRKFSAILNHNCNKLILVCTFLFV